MGNYGRILERLRQEKIKFNKGWLSRP